jgi:K+/H+ antiporter YhaU regulatory subunit KhtT
MNTAFDNTGSSDKLTGLLTRKTVTSLLVFIVAVNTRLAFYGRTIGDSKLWQTTDSKQINYSIHYL